MNISIIINFASSEFVKRVNISLQKKSNIYQVIDIDEKFLEYNKEIIDQKMKETRL